MATNARRYAKLVKMQHLIKARDEAELLAKRSEQIALEQEDSFLLDIISNATGSDIYDPLFVHKRLQRNAKMEAILTNKIERQRHVVLQSTKRFDALEDKHKTAIALEQRKELAGALEEYITAKIGKDTSLA